MRLIVSRIALYVVTAIIAITINFFLSVSEGPRDEVVIRTPDRRLRVFVSSTMGELAEERRAVSRAVSALRLTPVLFEVGARPYPPAEVCRAYLAQADVFIGDHADPSAHHLRGWPPRPTPGLTQRPGKRQSRPLCATASHAGLRPAKSIN